jgi:hypothetical protein
MERTYRELVFRFCNYPWGTMLCLAQVFGRTAVAIYRLLQNTPMGPEEIKVLTEAYEQTLRGRGLVDRNDPISEIVAKKIIEMGQRGVRDSKRLATLAIKELRVE